MAMTKDAAAPSQAKSRSVNVLLLISQLNRGGAERQLIELAKGLDRPRYRCTVCSLCDQVLLGDELRQAEIPLVVLDKKLPLDITRIPRLVRLLHREKIDIMHSFMIAGNSWGRAAAWLARTPVVITSVRNAVPNQPRSHTWINRILSPLTDAVVVNTAATRQLLIKRSEARPDRVRVIYNGVDLARFDLAVDVPAKRHELGLAPALATVGIVARFDAQKDHTTFLRAASMVLANRSDVQFVCVGGGPDLEAAKRLAGELGILDKVVFAGARTDIPEILFALDLLVLSSRWEGSPNVIIEGMAASLPVIATRVGGCPELVVDGETGLLVPPHDPRSLSLAVLSILGEPALATSMAYRGRRRVENQFSRERMVRETQQLYERLLAGRKTS